MRWSNWDSEGTYLADIFLLVVAIEVPIYLPD